MRFCFSLGKLKEGANSSSSEGKQLLVITEVPYQTSKVSESASIGFSVHEVMLHTFLHPRTFMPQADIVQHIAELVDNKTLEGVSDIRDESDREGLRVVVEV